MVRPRKIPKNFVPVDLSDTSSDEGRIEPEIVHNPLPTVDPIYEEIDEDDDEDDDAGLLVDEPPIPSDNPFDDILEALSKEWLLTEISHSVSKKASDLFWNIAKRQFHKLVQHQPKDRKIPSFTHIRRRITAKYCPEVMIDVAYKNSEYSNEAVKFPNKKG